jgi:hypothetical protein
MLAKEVVLNGKKIDNNILDPVYNDDEPNVQNDSKLIVKLECYHDDHSNQKVKQTNF